MQDATRVLMVSGGTGGHIFPMIAVAEELRARRGFEIEFLGTRRPLEAKLIPAAGFRLRPVAAAGLKGMGGIQRVRNLLVLPRSAFEVARILREFQPQVVVGIGGYLAGPVMLEAALAGIPTLLIEPNARPGFTNRLLAPVVRAAAVGFEEAERCFAGKAQVTGHPVRAAFFQVPPPHAAQTFTPARIESQGATDAPCPFTILVVGGSQGSRAMNQAMAAAATMLADVMPALKPANSGCESGAGASGQDGGIELAGVIRIVHQTGEHDYNEIRKAYQERGLAVEVHAFIDDMPRALSRADLVISRAGATAVAELAAAGRASVLIPFPGAADQHQLENARAMQKAGAARVIVQSELTPERMVAEIRELAVNPAALRKMEAAARPLAKPDAAARIADMVEALTERA